MAKQSPKTVTPIAQPTPAEDPNLIDIRDDEKHLLFKYNALTDEVEIKVRGKLYRVNIPELRFMVKRSVLTDDKPMTVVDLLPQETSQQAQGSILGDIPTSSDNLRLEIALEAAGSPSALDT